MQMAMRGMIRIDIHVMYLPVQNCCRVNVMLGPIFIFS